MVIHDGSERAVAGSSVTTLALSLLMVVLIGVRGSVTQKVGSRKSKLPISDYLVYSMVCLLAAVVGLVYNQAANISSEPRTTGYEVPPADSLSDDQRTLGYNETYNLRGWSCGVYDFAYSIRYSADALEQICTLATVARWIMIPLLLATLSMVGCAAVLARRPNNDVETAKMEI
ncbi:hypothetical protein BST61_g5500 [Cercospora zeina]